MGEVGKDGQDIFWFGEVLAEGGMNINYLVVREGRNGRGRRNEVRLFYESTDDYDEIFSLQYY